MHRRQHVTLWGALWVASSTGCLVDSEQRCGDNQRLEDGICLCALGHALQAGRCVEAASSRPAPDGGMGAACVPGSVPCSEPDFPLCQTAPSGASYCTSTGCKSDLECGAGFSCLTSASPSYCRRHYEGQRQRCTSTADCARFDAQHCVAQFGACVVRDCSADGCDPDWTCFPLSELIAGEPMVCAPNELIAK